MSLIALGLMPYITASIVVQIAVSASPTLAALKKEGESGRKTINQYTRYGTVLLCAAQGYFIATGLENWGLDQNRGAVINPGPLFRLTSVISLVGGSMLLMWIGEQITQRGVGNGVSLIITAGIIAQLPTAVGQVLASVNSGSLSLLTVGLIAAFAVILTAVICFMELGQRRVLIQYPKRRSIIPDGLQADRSHLPLKINMANVIPPIFASSLLLMPLTVAQFAGNRVQGESAWSDTVISVTTALQHGAPTYMVLYATGIFFDPEETATNLKRYGGFIPGIRPGEQTRQYLDYVITRITVVGAIYLTLICVIPEFLIARAGMPFLLGGTSLLIVVNVCADTMAQIKGHLISHEYGELITKAKLRGLR
jgi:preprotein translocase subunit SecY